MSQAPANATTIGSRVASQIGNAATVAGEKFDAAVGYAKERTHAFTDSAHHLVDDGWSSITGAAAKVPPYAQFLIGLGAGFCLAWFVRRHSSESH